MTRRELKDFGQARHGRYWIGPLAEETGYSFSQVWKMANVGDPADRISRRMELEIRHLAEKEAP